MPPAEHRLGLPLASLLAFLSAGCVLVLEIAAGRLMAPYVGVSLTTYTGIIGVILAGIAIGAWVGGRAADLYGPVGLLGPTFILGGLGAMASVPLVDALGAAGLGTGVGAIVLLAAIGFGLPATTLSAIAPMVVRATIVDVATSGVAGRAALGGGDARGDHGYVPDRLLPARHVSHPGDHPCDGRPARARRSVADVVGACPRRRRRGRGRGTGPRDHAGGGAGRVARGRRGEPRDTEPVRARERLLLHPGPGRWRPFVGAHADARPAAPRLRRPRRPELARVCIRPLVRLRRPRHRRSAQWRLRRCAPGWWWLHVPAPSGGGIPRRAGTPSSSSTPWSTRRRSRSWGSRRRPR